MADNPLADLPKSPAEYHARIRQFEPSWSPAEAAEIWRWGCLNDLYFLLRFGCMRADLEHPWLFERCREVQAAPDGFMDLWARDHRKSSIITFGLTIQDILKEPNTTVGIFSHTRPIAKGFLRWIKREFEANEVLKGLFPDILWQNPEHEAPKWSEDDGIVVKRSANPKESTVEAWGLVDGQPTGKHFKVRVYDDVVTLESITTPDQIAKTTNAARMSLNLGMEGGYARWIGTRYHFSDTYRTVVDSGIAKARVYPAEVAGEDGEKTPVLLTREVLDEKRRNMGPYIYASQMLLDPAADETQGFKREWIQFYDKRPDDVNENMTVYAFVDPANEKKRRSDYTVCWVVGLGEDRNYYVLDVTRDRLNLTERGDLMFKVHKKWRPRKMFYERYGLQADIPYFRDRMSRENYRFQIEELGGITKKNDRIRRLIPLFEGGRVYLPKVLRKTDYEGKVHELVSEFLDQEYTAFPVGGHDDMLDALAQLTHPDTRLSWPNAADTPKKREESKWERAFAKAKKKAGVSWMGR